MRLDVSGASSIDLEELSATSIQLNVSGASNVKCDQTPAVSGQVSVASTVTHPNGVAANVDVSGASTVKRR